MYFSKLFPLVTHFSRDLINLNIRFSNSGHIYQHELLLYTENCFATLKSIFINSTTIAERLAILYLMYAMYFKQPTKEFCKFRFTLLDWMKMKNVYSEIGLDSKYLQARTIFWRLWQCNAFRFVEADLEHCPETLPFHRLTNDGIHEFHKINSTVIGIVKDLQNKSSGLLSAIETLQVGYNEMKDHFASTMKECVNLKSIDTIGSVSSQLDKVKKLFETKYEGRHAGRKSKQKDQHETDYDSELNASNYSYSDSNDGDESQSEKSEDDDALDECLNIGTKRYYLKRKAAQQESGGIHWLRSTVIETSASPNKSQKSPAKEKITRKSPRKGNKSIPIADEVAKNVENDRIPTSLNDSNETIVINNSKKIYNRHSKAYVSTVRRQFTDCPK